jgi:hypothetical protein
VDGPLGKPVSARFDPDARITALAAVGCAAAVVLALTSAPIGRLLFAIAAVLLAGYVVSDLVFRPRLEADHDGLRVRAPLARATLLWAEVDSVRADERTRHGLRTVTLEIDSGDAVVVLSRRALGADPVQVAATLRALAPR